MSKLHNIASAPAIHASPALRRFASMTPQEHLEAHRRVMARPLVAAAINAQSGFEPIGVAAHRVVAKLMADHIAHHGTTPGLWKRN